MRDKFLIIKNRDRCDYRFDTHKWIDLAGADYLTDNDDILVTFLDRCNRRRLTRVHMVLMDLVCMLIVKKSNFLLSKIFWIKKNNFQQWCGHSWVEWGGIWYVGDGLVGPCNPCMGVGAWVLYVCNG